METLKPHLAAVLLRDAVADLGGARIQPDNGIVQRLSGEAVPHKRRLPLVGDSNGDHLKIARVDSDYVEVTGFENTFVR